MLACSPSRYQPWCARTVLPRLSSPYHLVQADWAFTRSAAASAALWHGDERRVYFSGGISDPSDWTVCNLTRVFKNIVSTAGAYVIFGTLLCSLGATLLLCPPHV